MFWVKGARNLTREPQARRIASVVWRLSASGHHQREQATRRATGLEVKPATPVPRGNALPQVKLRQRLPDGVSDVRWAEVGIVALDHAFVGVTKLVGDHGHGHPLHRQHAGVGVA